MKYKFNHNNLAETFIVSSIRYKVHKAKHANRLAKGATIEFSLIHRFLS